MDLPHLTITLRKTIVGSHTMCWFVAIDDETLRSRNGVGRRFKTPEAAFEAAMVEVRKIER